jgi:pimeloyl-ACP methyl ester carboxylesterase
VAAAARALAARPDSLSTLPQIDVPTLVVAGEQDAITPVETLRQIHEGVRGSRFVIVKDAGHLAPVEQPTEFTTQLGGFLNAIAMP